MDDMRAFFNLIDDFAIVVVDYNNGNIIYMNDEARQKVLVNLKAMNFFRNRNELQKVIGNKKKVRFRMTCNGENNLTGVFYRMNFENEDAVIAYFDKNVSPDADSDTTIILDGFYRQYYSVFMVNGNTGKYNILYSNGTLTKYSESFSDYTELIRDYCNNYVCGKDRVKVRRESDINNIIRRINESGPYQVNYQMNDGEWRGLKFMPVKDEYNDNLFMAGVVIFDKEMQNYQRVKNLQETISGLTETYQMICRVNLDNGKKEVLLNNEDGTDGLYITQFINENYSIYGKVYVDPSFRSELHSTITHKAVKEYFKYNDDIITKYFKEINGKWIEIKVAKDANYTEDSPYVVYAVKECTEKIESENRGIVSETALSKVFIAALIIDTEKDEYESVYKVEHIKGIARKGSFGNLMDNFRTIINKDDYDEFENTLKKAGSMYSGFAECEFQAIDEDSNEHFYDGMATNIHLPGGDRLLLLIMDNDERVVNRTNLISLNKEYDMTRTVLYTLGDAYFGMYYFDFTAGTIKTLRLPVDLCDIFERTQRIEEFTDEYVSRIAHPDDEMNIRRCNSREYLDEMMANGKDEIYCEYRRLVDNEYKWVRLDIKITKFCDGHTMEAVYALKDIHEERDMELKRNKQLVEATDAANRANEAKSNFLSNMSHDIRTPLNAIIGMTDMAINHIENRQRVYSNLMKIKSSGRILLYLVNNILDMSYIESGKVVVNESPLSLADLFHSVATMVQGQIKEKHLKFKVYAKNVKNEIVLSDKSTLNKIIINLLGNSIKYTKEYGLVSLSIEEQPTEIAGLSNYIIKISDTGIGMSEDFVKRMFEPFERAKDTTISGVEGTGLGMSITKQLIEIVGGNIDVKSELNVGSEFTVTIPLKHTEADDEDKMEYDIEDYKVFYIESDENNTYNEIKEYIGTKGHKEVVVVTSYDMEEDIPKFEKLGVKKIISEPVFNSDLRKLLSDKKNKARLKKDKNIFKGRKILIVEDNEINIDIISDYLDDVEIKYDSVRNGLDAYNRIKQNHSYDCVLMDIKMPVMDGYEATRKIRALDDEYVRKLPIIAMTANAFAEDVQKSKEAGMNDHITKPVNLELFYSVIKKHMIGEE